MADYLMTYSSLETAAGNITKAKGHIDDVIVELESAISALEGNWAGESYEAFRNAWTDAKPVMQKLSEAVGEFAPELTKAVASQQETDAGAAARIDQNLHF